MYSIFQGFEFVKNKEILLESFESKYNEKFVCKRPFELVEIDLDGNVYFCFPRCNDTSYKVGNLYDLSFEDISFSETALIFKKDILNSNYKYCDFNYCNAPNIDLHYQNFSFSESMGITYPLELRLHIDNICNVKCFMCRSEHIVHNNKEKQFREILIPRIVSMCRKAKKIFMNGQGEVFFSPLAKELILEITKNYPNISFDFCTNALGFTEKNLKEYNLENKVESVSVSMHAIKKSTYEKIVVGGNYNKLIENLKYIKYLFDSKHLKNVTLNFVVCKYNYNEMIDFQDYANKNGFNCFFSSLVDVGIITKNFDDIALRNRKSIDYYKFCKIIVNSIFNNNCIFDNNLNEIRNSLLLENKSQSFIGFIIRNLIK